MIDSCLEVWVMDYVRDLGAGKAILVVFCATCVMYCVDCYLVEIGIHL